MTVTREELAAFADGELEPEDRARVAKALAADPELRRQLEVHRQVKTVLSAHYDPILDQAVPDRLTEAVTSGISATPEPVAETSDGEADAADDDWPETAEVVSFEAAKAARDGRLRIPNWRYVAAPALAASLVAVAVFSLRGGPEAPARGDYAGTQLAAVLESQLVADQGQAADTRILLSFRDDADRYCRAFSGKSAGIACRDGKGWQLQRVGKGGDAQTTDYRQAGASDAQLLEAAQAMAKGDALDAQGEAAAKKSGWR